MEVKMKGKTLDKDLQKINYNSFILAPILMAFYKDCHVSKDNILLSYLIFPILFSNKWKGLNVKIRKDSKLEKWVLKDQMPIEGLCERIEFFADCTTTALQYCFDQKWAYIDEDSNVILTDNMDWNDNSQRIMHFATKFNCLIAQMSVSQIYSSLGISKLCIHE